MTEEWLWSDGYRFTITIIIIEGFTDEFLTGGKSALPMDFGCLPTNFPIDNFIFL